jgi:hypothetical protein
MAMLTNNSAPPVFSPGLHVLEIEGIDVVQKPKFQGGPDELEDRVRMDVKIRTPGEPTETFVAWMSTSLNAKARLGNIVEAVLGGPPRDRTFDTDALVGAKFKAVVLANDRQYPTISVGSCVPLRAGEDPDGDEPTF